METPGSGTRCGYPRLSDCSWPQPSPGECALTAVGVTARGTNRTTATGTTINNELDQIWLHAWSPSTARIRGTVA